MDPYRKAQRGDRVSFSTLAYNAQLEAAQASRRNRALAQAGALTSSMSSSIILVKNNAAGGIALDRFAVLGLDQPIFLPSASLPAFQQAPCFSGIIPAAAVHQLKFCITLEPLLSTQVGRAVVQGAAVVKVNMIASGDTVAGVTDASTAKLTSGGGPALILWSETGTGDKWAIVALGAGTQRAGSPGKASGTISARIAGNYGSGTVLLYKAASGVETSTGITVSVLNAAADSGGVSGSIASGKYCWVEWDVYGQAWVSPLEC
jgi:hypothetical protein